MRKRYAIANWKMNTDLSEAIVLANAMKKSAEDVDGVEIVICPPSVWLYPIHELYEHKPSNLALGAQNMYYKEQGAFTGELSPTMIKDMSQYVILGHSERRHIFGEDDELIHDKVLSALKHNLIPIICVGEKEKTTVIDPERKKGIFSQLISALSGISKDELDKVIIAYEPVWAIGTGDSATPEYVEDICSALRETIEKHHGKEAAQSMSILYGGSVNKENIYEYAQLDNVDGVLVGGASLKVDSFQEIIEAIAS